MTKQISMGPEILALGDRFSAAYKSIEETISEFGHLTFRSEKSFPSADAVVDFIRNSSIDAVLMPNPYGNERRMWVYKKLRNLDFPVVVFDRGALPNSWFFDVGFNADSPSYHPTRWDQPLSQEQTASIERYVCDVKDRLEPLEKQGDRLGGEGLRAKLKLGGKKVLFVPFQRPSDTTIKFFSGDIESFDNFVRLVNKTKHALETTMSDWVIVAKKHPLETNRPIANVIFADDDVHVNDLLELSDAVLLVNSGVGLLAALWEKPVLHAGQAFYSHVDLNRRVSTHDDVLYWLQRGFSVSVDARNRLLHHLVNNVYSFGNFETELVAQKDGSFRNITRKISFERVNNPLRVTKKKRVLFVTPVIPFPINRGSAQRTDQMIRALLANEMRVKLLVLNQSEAGVPSVKIKERLQKHYNTTNLIVEVRKHPKFTKPTSWKNKIRRYSYNLGQRVDRLTGRNALINNRHDLPQSFEASIHKELEVDRYDIAWFNYMKVKPTQLRSNGAKVVVDMHDHQAARVENDVLPALKPSRRQSFLQTFMASEKAALDSVDVAISISPVETEQLMAAYQPSTTVITIPATDDPRFVSAVEPKFDLAFIGSNSDPNVDGISWFVTSVFPRVVASLKDVRLLIQGNVTRNSKLKKAIAESGHASSITVQGYVEKISAVYACTKLVICPIRYGTGMKIKVIEAMSHAKAMIATGIALEGIERDFGLSSYDNAEEFSDACVAALASADARTRLEEISRRTFLAHYSHAHLRAQVLELINICLKELADGRAAEEIDRGGEVFSEGGAGSQR